MNPPMTLEGSLDWYEGMRKDNERKVFAILVRNDEGRDWRYVGHTELHRITWPDGCAATGTFIGDVSAHRNGHGTEAKLMLLYHAFYTLGLRNVMSEIKAFNGNSFGHLLKTGYQPCGVHKKLRFHAGTFVDEIRFQVTREDFDPIWTRYRNTEQLPKLSEKQKELMAVLMP